MNNHAALPSLLLDAGVRPDDNESLYHSSEVCWKGYVDLVRLLLDHGAPSTSRTAPSMPRP
ncbi:MAG TPA: hypothetical protein VMB03_04100 [Bryobacteraceae bacterium]|nr:hypothetical protein [Bryobacteraceae bacterium]